MPTEPLDKPSLETCVVWGIIAALIILIPGILATRNAKMVPGKLQNFFEFVLDGLRKLYLGLLGPGGERHLPVVLTLFFYILVCNLLSVTPFRAPTSNLSTNLGLALFVFIYVNYWSIKTKGLGGYLLHLTGPEALPLVLRLVLPLFLLIEVVSLFAQPLSLAMRLYGNIYGEDYISYVVSFVMGHIGVVWQHAANPENNSTVGIPAQVLVYGLILFTGILQAFIFTLLSSAYIGIATQGHGDQTDHVDHGHDDQGHPSATKTLDGGAYVPTL